MSTRHLQFSIVVVAKDWNPTILNPDFLTLRGIVPPEWGWKVSGHPITTPPLAVVRYDSGVLIQIEPARCQVIDALKERDPESSRIVSIATRYVEVLPHVPYTAVGNNFQTHIGDPDAESFLKQRFLKEGIWDGEAHRLRGLRLSLVYPLQDGRVSLTLESAGLSEPADAGAREIRGILVNGNFHRECSGYPADQQVVAHIMKASDDWEHYIGLLRDVLGPSETLEAPTEVGQPC